MRVPDIAALTSCPTAVIRAQLLSARGRASDEALGSASASGGIQCPSSPWKYFFQLMSFCSPLHWRAAPEFLWEWLLPVSEIYLPIAYYLASQTHPTCCVYLIFCPILECLSHLRLQPLPPCSIPLLTRLSKSEGLQAKRKKKSVLAKEKSAAAVPGCRGSGWPVSWAGCEEITPIVTEKVRFIFTNTFYCQHILDF